MRRSNVATAMSIFGNATIRAKQRANSKDFEMEMVKKGSEKSHGDREQMAALL
jgi:hypothetical protein